jgi:hypothetical protein
MDDLVRTESLSEEVCRSYEDLRDSLKSWSRQQEIRNEHLPSERLLG